MTKIDDGKIYDYHSEKKRNDVPKTLDDQFEKDGKDFINSGQKIELTYNIQNTLRTIGTKISSVITRKYGMNSLSEDHVTLKLRGSAGQSLGAFAVRGLTLKVFGMLMTTLVKAFPVEKLLFNLKLICPAQS